MGYLDALENDVQEIKQKLNVLIELTEVRAQTEINEYSKYPPVLTLKHVSEIMGINSTSTSNCVHREDFPKIIVGRRILIPKQAFLNWLDKQATEK